eukprot:SAG11_NODE_477_length_9118_cov_3.513582_9_plen_170_part_00
MVHIVLSECALGKKQPQCGMPSRTAADDCNALPDTAAGLALVPAAAVHRAFHSQQPNFFRLLTRLLLAELRRAMLRRPLPRERRLPLPVQTGEIAGQPENKRQHPGVKPHPQRRQPELQRRQPEGEQRACRDGDHICGHRAAAVSGTAAALRCWRGGCGWALPHRTKRG